VTRQRGHDLLATAPPGTRKNARRVVLRKFRWAIASTFATGASSSSGASCDSLWCSALFAGPAQLHRVYPQFGSTWCMARAHREFPVVQRPVEIHSLPTASKRANDVKHPGSPYPKVRGLVILRSTAIVRE
jgi:hypothetical protein